MQQPNWINIIVSARTRDGDPPAFASNYLFEIPWHATEPGKWYTLSVPFSEFKRLSGGKNALTSEVPFQVLFNSTAPDRGLVLDRVWVTRGGPGVVQQKPAP
jgi:hypothetical protein